MPLAVDQLPERRAVLKQIAADLREIRNRIEQVEGPYAGDLSDAAITTARAAIHVERAAWKEGAVANFAAGLDR